MKPAPPSAAESLEAAGIQNAFRVTSRIYSGSQPEGDDAFAALARLGVKTVISVDGAMPDLAAARLHGLRYVHLPIGYDGPTAGRAAQLAQAASTIPGLIFIHCHHGRHRGPAAAALVCETTEGWTTEFAEAWLRQAGTAPDYPGLYRSVRTFQPPTPDILSHLAPLPETVKATPLIDAMLEIDARLDSLKAIQNTGWKIPPAASERSPALEATLLWEHFRELARTDDAAQPPAGYRAKLADSERAAETLLTLLRAETPDRTALDTAMHQSTQSCTACHKSFRNPAKP